jgi:predicted HTH domain antitoxin
MPRAAFMQLLGEHEVPVIDYAVEDLQEELRSLNSR